MFSISFATMNWTGVQAYLFLSVRFSSGGALLVFAPGFCTLAAVNEQEEDVHTHHWEKDGTAWILHNNNDGSVDATIIPGKEMWQPGDPM